MLLDLFRKYPILKDVLKSLTKPYKQILLSLALFIILSYYFTIYFYYQYHMQEADPICDKLFNCFVYVFDRTFKESAGFITGKENIYLDEWKDYGRVIYNMLYIFVIIILCKEIISGIIIDTFKELRQYQEEKDKQKTEYCFLCGKHQSEFENLKGGFKNHIKIDHNIWNYLYYIATVYSKRAIDDTGIQSYIRKKLEG